MVEIKKINAFVNGYCNEVRNSRITKSSYKIELRKMTSQSELLTQSLLTEILLSSY